MSLGSDNSEVNWIVCEQGDRWYRAVCRFAPDVVVAPSRLRVERISREAAKQVVPRAKAARGASIVCWELPLVWSEFSARLEWIATIRCDASDVLQVAWLPATAASEQLLYAQEAGIGLFLEGPESLQRAGEMVARRLSPLG